MFLEVVQQRRNLNADQSPVCDLLDIDYKLGVCSFYLDEPPTTAEQLNKFIQESPASVASSAN